MGIRVLVLVLALGAALPRPAGAFDSASELAAAYLDAVDKGDWPAAASLWATADLAASERLGVVYDGVPLKIDCASPLLLERGRWAAANAQIRVEPEGTDHARIRIDLGPATGGAVARYDARRIDDRWRLITAAGARTEDWERLETEFLEIRTDDPTRVSDHALRLLDDFVRTTCRRLDVPDERLEHLRRHKLLYLLADESTVEALAGAPTRGVALLPIDAVVTSEPCHLHELAHLLVNYALQKTPLYTLPFLQEGTAVALGGRWGRSPQTMLGLGKFTLQGGMVSASDLLTMPSFRSQGADWTYAPSGVVAAYLLQALGGRDFLALYRDLSGEFAELAALDEAAIRERIGILAQRDWPTLERELDEFAAALSCGGVLPAGEPQGAVVAQARQGDCDVNLAKHEDSWIWTVTGLDPSARCVVLLRCGSDNGAPTRSRLFDEQIGGRPYAGQGGALIVAPGEIGLYDFQADLLLAKWVEGFCPDFAATAPDGAGPVRFVVPAVAGDSWRIEAVTVER